MPVSNGRCGRWRDHRQMIDGILHRVRTGVQWPDLPERFGPWKTVYERHRIWSADGTWERLLQQVQAAAGARSEPPPTQVALKGGRETRSPEQDSVAEPGPPPGGDGAGGEGLGRSRGGFTSKIHLGADGRSRRVPRLGPGRPRKKPDSVAADRAYSNGACREYLRCRGIQHTIPKKSRQPCGSPAQGLTRRTATGLREERHKKRNTSNGPSTGSRTPGPLRRGMTSAATSFWAR